jgi:hypothetical protein
LSTGATIALVVGGVAVVGGVGYLILHKASPAAAAAKKPASTPSAGSLIASLGGSLVSRLGNDAIDSLEDQVSDWLS